MKIRHKANYGLFFLLILLTISCQTYVPAGHVPQRNPEYTPHPEYTPPNQGDYVNINFERTINKSYDEVWSALIEYSASTFFAINTFEKESGLLTLKFGAANPDKYIDCGEIQSVNTDYSGSAIGAFEAGDYADLDGAMNIFVKPISSNVTQVRVNARYIFRASDGYSKQIWSFDSGGSDTKRIGGVSQMTCIPTHEAEETIIDGIDRIAKGIRN